MLIKHGMKFQKRIRNCTPICKQSRQYIQGNVYAHWQTNTASFKLYESTETNWQAFDYFVSSTAPTANYKNGDYWLDTANTNWGLYVGNGTVWNSQAVSVVDPPNIDGSTKTPISSYVPSNDYAVVVSDRNVGATYFKKKKKKKLQMVLQKLQMIQLQ